MGSIIKEIPKRYVAYTRISDDKYNGSLETQEKMILQLAKRHNIKKRCIDRFKESVSGYKEDQKRPEFEKMMELLEKDNEDNNGKPENRTYEGVLFRKLDRLARNGGDFLRLGKLLEAGYKFISVTEVIENNYTGHLLFRILSSFAIFESAKLSARVIIAKIHNAIQKKYKSLGGSKTIQFGYKVSKKKRYVPVKNEGEIINFIYNELLVTVKTLPADTSKKDIFAKVGEELDLLYPNFYKDYKKRLSSSKKAIEDMPKSKDKLISQIITKDLRIRHDGFLVYHPKISDGTISEYLNSLQLEEHEGFFLKGATDVGGSFEIAYYDEALQFVDSYVYDSVKEWVSSRKTRRYGFEEDSMFPGFTFLFPHGEKLSPQYYPHPKDGNITYQYRKEHNEVKLNKSELSVEKALWNNKKINKMYRELPKKKEEIIKYLKKKKDYFKDGTFSGMHGALNLYKYSIEKAENKLLHLDPVKDKARFKKILQEKNRYKKNEIKVLEKIRLYEKKIDSIMLDLDEIGSLAWLKKPDDKTLIEEWRVLKRLGYQLLFSEVCVNFTKAKPCVDVVLNPDVTKILGIKDGNVITGITFKQPQKNT